MKSKDTRRKLSVLAFLHSVSPSIWKAWFPRSGRGCAVLGADPPAHEVGRRFHIPGELAYDPAEIQLMLGLARQTLECVVAGRALPEPGDVPARICEKRACFVTLTWHGALRGCVGQVQAQYPLFQAIIENSRNAATRDRRFAPVEAFELAEVKVEISVLSDLTRLTFATEAELLEQLQPYRHGVLMEICGSVATFLPQVWELFPNKKNFLDHLAQKSGFPPSAWQGRDVTFSIYDVESFGDSS